MLLWSHMDAYLVWLKRHTLIVQIVLVCVAGLFLSINIDRQLVDYDEATYAKVVVDTLRAGQVIDLDRSGHTWFEKPPLYYWIAMVSVSVFGAHEFAFRIPSILAAVLCCWLVFQILNQLTRNQLAAICGFLVLLFSDVFVFYGREMRLDSSVTAMILAALYFFIKSWKDERFLLVVLPAIAVGCMFKSVIALLAFPVLLLYAVVYRQWRFLSSHYFPLGALIALLIWAPWHIAESIHFGEAFWNNYLGTQVIVRAVSMLTGTSGMWDYVIMLAWSLPWNVILAVELVTLGACAWVYRKSEHVALSPMLLPLSIAVGIVALFTAARTHLGAYIVPALPFFALSIAVGYDALSSISRRLAIVFSVIMILGTIGGCYFCFTVMNTLVPYYTYDERMVGEQYRMQHMPEVPLYSFNWSTVETLDYYGDTDVIPLMPSTGSGSIVRGPFFLAIHSVNIPNLFNQDGSPKFPGLKLIYVGQVLSLFYGSQDFPLP